MLGSVADDSAPIFLTDCANIVVETVKPADTAENALLVRAYEAMGMRAEAHCTVSGKIRGICETDMLEENGTELNRGELNVSFAPFEIKTFLLYL